MKEKMKFYDCIIVPFFYDPIWFDYNMKDIPSWSEKSKCRKSAQDDSQIRVFGESFKQRMTEEGNPNREVRCFKLTDREKTGKGMLYKNVNTKYFLDGRGDRQNQFVISDIYIWLFENGIGFVTIECETTDLEDYQDVIIFARALYAVREKTSFRWTRTVMDQRTQKLDKKNIPVSFKELIKELLSGFNDELQSGSKRKRTFLREADHCKGRYPVCYDRIYKLSYLCVDNEDKMKRLVDIGKRLAMNYTRLNRIIPSHCDSCTVLDSVYSYYEQIMSSTTFVVVGNLGKCEEEVDKQFMEHEFSINLYSKYLTMFLYNIQFSMYLKELEFYVERPLDSLRDIYLSMINRFDLMGTYMWTPVIQTPEYNHIDKWYKYCRKYLGITRKKVRKLKSRLLEQDNDKKFSVFISYRRKNITEGDMIPIASDIYHYLETKKIYAFYDFRSISTSELWKEKIDYVLKMECSVFVILLRKNTLSRCKEPGDELCYEIKTAMENKLKIILVAFDDFEWPNKKKLKKYPKEIQEISKKNFLRCRQWADREHNEMLGCLCDEIIGKKTDR